MILTEYKKHRNAKFDARLLWDADVKQFDFQKGKQIVVERVVERGTPEDWYAILNMYGEEIITDEIKKIPRMTRRDMNFVHKFLHIPLKELLSYRNYQAGQKHWTEA